MISKPSITRNVPDSKSESTNQMGHTSVQTCTSLFHNLPFFYVCMSHQASGKAQFLSDGTFSVGSTWWIPWHFQAWTNDQNCLHVTKYEIVLMIINTDQNNDQLNSLLSVVRGLHNSIKSIKWSNRVDKYIFYYFLSLIFWKLLLTWNPTTLIFLKIIDSHSIHTRHHTYPLFLVYCPHPIV